MNKPVSVINIFGVLICLVGIFLIIFVSLIIGIIVFVLGILLLAIQQAIASKEPDKWNPKGYKKCPYCAETIKMEAVVCKHCGANFSANPLNAGGGRIGTIRNDVIVDNQIAFQPGELVQVLSISPDPARPDYQYIVFSRALDRQFKLSNNEIMFS